ncbi:MAG: hypothetical protein [Namikivirus sakae]|uniref:Uncharacterized protein n=1 Tax=Bacteriophage sp. TaxID=38018 RepID=A0ABY5TS89_9VIRU|nr:MAG: hypothetical protein [Bacteriophage sp.]
MSDKSLAQHKRSKQMETAKYLTTIISLIMQQPKIGTILDEDGIDPEINYGQIGLTDYDALIRLYGLLNSIEGVETTPVHETYNGLGHDFTVTAPITLHFFHWK